jgi:ribosomal protein S18 acetylase RimI-like enzyme
VIRPFAARDHEHARALLAATGSFNAAELDVADELMDIVLTRPEQHDYHAFVVCDDDAAPATGLLIIGPAAATVGTWHMYWIATHPQRHGSGAAQQLADFAEAFVRERSGYLIMVETSSQPAYGRTRRFYAKQGYTEIARVADYYRPGDDLVMLSKRLA